jgi:tetratricopeptide (TPR) repeat protein
MTRRSRPMAAHDTDISPLDPEQTKRALAGVEDRDRVVMLLLRAMRSKARFACFLAARHDFAVGRVALVGDQVDRERITKIRIPLTSPLFQRVIGSGVPYAGPLAAKEWGAEMIRYLESVVPRAALLMPLSIGGRMAGIAIGHFGDKAPAVDELRPLFAVGDAAAAALERLVIKSKESVGAGRAAAVAAEVRAEPDPQALVAATRKEIAARPHDLEARRKLVRLSRGLEAWAELSQALEQLVETGSATGQIGEDEQIELRVEIAELERDVLGRVPQAISAWRRVLEIDPGDLRAMTALEALLSTESRWEECIEVLEKRALIVEGNPARAEVLLRIADLLSYTLDAPARAAQVFERVLILDPTNVPAAEALESFYRKERRWAQLGDLLLEKARHASSDAGREELLVAVARMLEDDAHDPASAFLVWQTVARQDPAQTGPRDELDRIAASLGNWDEHLDFLEELAEALEGTRPAAAAELWTAIARAAWEQLGNVDRALEAAHRALRAEPKRVEALELVGTLLRSRQSWAELVQVQQRHVAVETDPDKKVALLLSTASVLEHELDDPTQALATYEAAIALDPENPDAIAALLRSYRWSERWDDLIQLLERVVTARLLPAGGETFTDLQLELGRLLQQRGAKPAKAIGVLEAMLEREPHHREALLGLASALGEQAKLHRAAKDWPALVAVYEREAQLTTDERKRVELYTAMGEVLERELHDGERALDAYVHALAQDGQEPAALAGAARVHEQAGRWKPAADLLDKLVAATGDVDAVIRLGRAWSKLAPRPRADFQRLAEALARAEAATSDPVRRSLLLTEEARLHGEHLDDAVRAEERLARAVASDPDNLGAAATLSAIYFGRGEWAKAAPLLTAVAAQQKTAVAHERAAVAARELGELEAAERHFGRALELEPARLSALLGRADVLSRLSRWEASAKLDQSLVLQHRDKLARPDLLAAYRRQGIAYHRLGQTKKALTMLDLALEIEPKDVEALERIAEIHRAQGQPSVAAGVQRRLLAAWQDALTADPGNHRLLQKLLDAQSEQGDWKGAIQTIERFLQIEKDPARRGLYHHAAAAIHREQLKGLDEAIEHYDLALDEFFRGELPVAMRPRALEAFRAIDELLTQKKDWVNQQRAYRRMIKRLAPGDPLLLSLWDSLGEVCRSRLKQTDQAIEAFEVAQRLDPENPKRKQILAELYAAGGQGRLAQAAASHAELLRAAPRRADVYHQLFRLYLDAQQLDQAWCVARALVFLGAATAEEAQLHQLHEPADFPATRAVMSEDVWRHIYHPEENRFISAVFSVMWKVVALARARRHSELGLDRKDVVDVSKDPSLLAQVIVYASRTLNLELPELYVEEKKRGVVSLANCVVKGELTPGLIVRQNFLEVSSRRQVAFVLTRMLARMRPEHYLKLALPTTAELKAAFLAAIVLVQPGLGIPPELHEEVTELAGKLRAGLPPRRMEELFTVVKLFLKSETAVDLSRWALAVETTAHRAGLILCGDLKTAAELVTQERTFVGGPGPQDKVNELLLYSVSEDYFAVRRLLGLQVR